MTDEILCLETVKKNRERAKALAFAKAKPNFVNLKLPFREKEKNELWEKKQDEWQENNIQECMDENQCSREEAINQIKAEEEKAKQRSLEYELHNKRMRKTLGAYATGGEFTDGLDGIVNLYSDCRSAMDNLLHRIDNEFDGKIDVEPKGWLLNQLLWDTQFQIKELETLGRRVNNRINDLNDTEASSQPVS